MSTAQFGLFPDDETPALVPVGMTGSTKVLTPAQRRFNKLIAEIELAKAQLAEWQAAATAGRAEAAAALTPRRAALRVLQRRMVTRLDTLLAAPDAPKLTRRRRDAVREMLVQLVADMLEEEHDDELVAVHDRHADLTRAEQNQLDADIAREMLGQMLGEDALPDDANASLDEVLRAAHAQLQEREQAQEQERERKARKRAERRRAQGKGPTREEKLAQARHAAGQSLREVYRKLASALHPDRAASPAEQQRRTALMQRANRAYEAQDLLGLLTLQIEAEQIDAAHLSDLADERVQHYNLVLQEQLETLRGEIAECAQTLGIHRVGPGGPRAAVQQALQSDLAGVDAARRQLEADLATLEDPKRRVGLIDAWVADQRDTGMSDADLAMFSAMMGLDDASPPRRRRRR